MNRKISHIITLSILCLLTASPIQAQLNARYTDENPVIVASDWDFPPYEYSDNQGDPAGYNVELLQRIFAKLGISYRIILREWSEAAQTFERHDADLVIDPTYRFRGLPYIRSTNILNYYKVQIVSSSEARHVTRLSDLTPTDTIVLKKDDYAANRILGDHRTDAPVIFRSPKEALAGISEGRYHYFIWGEGPLMWKKKELAIDTMIVAPINIPDGEIRVVGYDKELVDAIDDEYARLEQSGDLEALRDKWFHPERIHDDTSPVALFVLAGAAIAVIIGLLLTRLVRARVRQVVHRAQDLNYMMEQALNMGNYYVFTIDVVTGRIHNIHGELLPEGELVREAFLPRIDQQEKDEFQQKVDLLISGNLQQARYTKRLNIGTHEEPTWLWLSGLATLEYENGKPRYIINTARDITSQIDEERFNSELSVKYMKIFETNIMAMSFFDAEGNIIDLNDNMRKLTNVTEKNEAWYRKMNIFETSFIKGQYQRDSNEQFHACQHAYIPELGLDKYIEIRIRPVFDNEGVLKYYVLTAREITAERELYLDQVRHNKEMQRTGEAISSYESQLQYLLDNTQMFIWHYIPQSGEIVYSHSSRKNEYHETLHEFFEGVDPDNQEQALADIVACVEAKKPYQAIHHYQYTPREPHPVWYAISGIPTFDREGNLVNYFGIARNITVLMQAQQQLKQETSRAEDSGRMKSAFLANMTHEIRTPLNAIVGFSDLLPVVETQGERMEFIRIIRNNCDMLMRLINDILEASTMGQALAIEAKACDFAKVFDDICQTLAQRVQEPGVEFIRENPYPVCQTVLDKGRVQQVLTNFVTNAVKYTRQGHIKVGYHWDRRPKCDGSGITDGLLFYCQDTGTGIPKEKQASIFERFVKLNDFVQGTGLGLSICQNIAERCNGHIGVTSEGEGHGSTFWFWIPCPRSY